MIWATVSSRSCFFADCIELFHFGCKEYNQSDFGIDHLVMSMCRDLSCVVGRGCLLWPVHSHDKTLLAFALIHFVLQGQICLLLQVFLDFLLLHSSPLWWKGHLLGVLVLESLVVVHRTIQLQLLQHYWSGDTLITVILNGLPWKWTKIILSFLRLHPVLHFRLFCWPWWLLHFFWGILARSSRDNGHLS